MICEAKNPRTHFNKWIFRLCSLACWLTPYLLAFLIFQFCDCDTCLHVCAPLWMTQCRLCARNFVVVAAAAVCQAAFVWSHLFIELYGLYIEFRLIGFECGWEIVFYDCFSKWMLLCNIVESGINLNIHFIVPCNRENAHSHWPRQGRGDVHQPAPACSNKYVHTHTHRARAGDCIDFCSVLSLLFFAY